MGLAASASGPDSSMPGAPGALVTVLLGRRSCYRFMMMGVALVVLVGCGGSVESTAVMPEPEPTAEPVTYDLVTPELLTSCAAVGEINDLDILDDRVVFGGDFEAVIDADGVRHDQAGVGACTHDGAFLAFDHPVDGLVRAVAAYNDMLLVGGNFTVAGSSNQSFAALNALTGELLDFGPRQVMGSVHSISIGESGSIYLGGAFNRVDGVNRTAVVRVNASGVFDSEFSPRLGRTDDEANARIVYSIVEDGNRVYIGGDFAALNGEPVPGVGAVDFDTGRITTAFMPNLDDGDPDDGRVQVRSIAVKGDWVYLCGDWWATEGRGDTDLQRNFGRFNRSGEADAGLEPWTNGVVRDCGLVGDDVVSLGGHFDVINGQQWPKLVLISVDTGEVLQVVEPNSNRGVQVVGFDDGLLYIGGTFDEIDGVDQQSLAAIRVAEPLNG